MPKDRVTIHEVAGRAGVSVATASRALSGRRKVTPSIAQQVRKAAKELGYRPNAVAQALRDQVTKTVGMVVPGISNPFFTAMVEAVEHRLQSSGRHLLLCDSQYDPDIEAGRLGALIERQVDGLIISPCDMVRSGPAVREAVRRVPLVQIDRYIEGSVSDWVGVDDDAALSLAVTHLVAAGAQSLAFVSSELTNSSARLRLAGFERAARTAGAEVRGTLLGAFTIEWGFEAAERLARDGLPDGIVCANDEIALGLLRRLRSMDVKVPEEVMVTGFDDTGYAAIFDPPLTTIRQPCEQLAEDALRLLDEARAARSRPPRRIAITPQLVVRATTRA
ncbi:MAG: transcriptional regulator, LacI family [Gemmatimonadales bacterium]|nr:transcriptional regulator, LacI family [Gemmatimonadales bacterium]